MSKYNVRMTGHGLDMDAVRKVRRFAFAAGDEQGCAAYCPMVDDFKIGPPGATVEEAMLVLGCDTCPFSQDCVGATNAQLTELLQPVLMQKLFELMMKDDGGEVQ